EENETTVGRRRETRPGRCDSKRRRRNAGIKRIPGPEHRRTTARVRDWRASVTTGAGAGIRCQRLSRADVGRVQNAVTATQHNRLVSLPTAVSEADTRSEVVLVGVREVTSTRRVVARHLNRLGRWIEIGLPVEALGWRRKNVVAKTEVQRQIIVHLPIILHEEGDLFARLEVWTTRIAAAYETRLVTEQEIRERGAGIVWSNA